MDTAGIGNAAPLRLVDPHQAREIADSYKAIRAESIETRREERLAGC